MNSNKRLCLYLCPVRCYKYSLLHFCPPGNPFLGTIPELIVQLLLFTGYSAKPELLLPAGLRGCHVPKYRRFADYFPAAEPDTMHSIGKAVYRYSVHRFFILFYFHLISRIHGCRLPGHPFRCCGGSESGRLRWRIPQAHRLPPVYSSGRFCRIHIPGLPYH